MQHYDYPTYLAYLLFPPLYIAGPTMTFNCFASQLAAPPRLPGGKVAMYVGVRCQGSPAMSHGSGTMSHPHP